MTQELIIIRGLPGSGKSTFAKMLIDHSPLYPEERSEDWYHIETDMFFDTRDGYKFDAKKLSEAHAWCQNKTKQILESGCSIIVSNTFSRVWEMQPYIDMAWKVDCRFTVIEVQGNHGSIHDVPDENIQKMKARWEKYPQ